MYLFHLIQIPGNAQIPGNEVELMKKSMLIVRSGNLPTHIDKHFGSIWVTKVMTLILKHFRFSYHETLREVEGNRKTMENNRILQEMALQGIKNPMKSP